ncbi:G-D-S-L family lipolytic protein [Chryseobacterium sp. KACC 21268]|nr:G-D-S-L family lipolytic protein [Chryseobacterium sp. KACC 21268]
MKKLYISTVAATLLLAASCQNDFENSTEDVVVTAGDANFSNYVALGNSLTSGYRDGALYVDGQTESYPNMLSSQMRLAGGGDFKQPLMADNNGGLLLTTPNGNVQIADTKRIITGFSAGSPVITFANENKASTVVNTVLTGPFNNMGVPGAKVSHLLAPGYGNVQGILAKTANPYFVRFASSPTTSVIQDFLTQKPTFFTLWIGNNDALLYALAGADDSVETLTPVANFEQYYNVLISQIKTSGAKGAIANIPNVTSIPSLTTVPYNPLTASLLGKGDVNVGNATIDNLNASLYGPLSQILTALGAGDRIKPLSKTATNPLLMVDETLPDLSLQITGAALQSGNATLVALAPYLGATYGRARQTRSTDLIPLTTPGAIGTVATLPPGIPASLAARGVSYPFEDRYILTRTEATTIDSAINSYNNVIKTAATAGGYAFVDANAKMIELNSTSGIQYDGVKYSAKFVTGGSFSLDGVHLTGRGYAIVANEFLKAINSKYRSNLPMISPNSYSGIKFP